MNLHIVYRMYDSNNELLYVGCTKNLLARIGSHQSDKEWKYDIKNITLEYFDNRLDALNAESKYQKNENPKYSIPSSIAKKETVKYKINLILDWLTNEWQSPDDFNLCKVTKFYFRTLERKGLCESKKDEKSIFSFKKVYRLKEKS